MLFIPNYPKSIWDNLGHLLLDLEHMFCYDVVAVI
jgi:hypothetical protein